MTDIRADMADTIEPGMTEASGGETIARVSRVNTEPSVIMTTGVTERNTRSPLSKGAASPKRTKARRVVSSSNYQTTDRTTSR